MAALPNELWVHQIIPAVFQERMREDDQSKVHWRTTGVSHLGSLYVKQGWAEFYPTTFTLVALRRTCRLLCKTIEPHAIGHTFSYFRK